METEDVFDFSDNLEKVFTKEINKKREARKKQTDIIEALLMNQGANKDIVRNENELMVIEEKEIKVEVDRPYKKTKRAFKIDPNSDILKRRDEHVMEEEKPDKVEGDGDKVIQGNYLKPKVYMYKEDNERGNEDESMLVFQISGTEKDSVFNTQKQENEDEEYETLSFDENKPLKSVNVVYNEMGKEQISVKYEENKIIFENKGDTEEFNVVSIIDNEKWILVEIDENEGSIKKLCETELTLLSKNKGVN